MTIYITNHAGLILDRYTPPKLVRGFILVVAAARRVYRAVAGALTRKDLGIGSIRVTNQKPHSERQAGLGEAAAASEVVSALVNLGLPQRMAKVTVERVLGDLGRHGMMAGGLDFETLLRASLARTGTQGRGLA